MASLHLSWKGERLYLTLGRSAVGISWRPTDGGAAKAKLYFADHGIMTLKCLVLPCPCLTGMLSWALREVAVGMFYTMQSCRPTRKEWTSPERSHLVLGQHQSSGQVGMGVGGGCLGCGGAVGEPLSCARSSWWIMQILLEKVIKLKPWSFSKSLRCCVLHVCAEFRHWEHPLGLHLQTWYQENRRENGVWEIKWYWETSHALGRQLVRAE